MFILLEITWSLILSSPLRFWKKNVVNKARPCRKRPFSFTSAEAERCLPGETLAVCCHEVGPCCFFSLTSSSLTNKCPFFWRLTPKGRCLLWSLGKASNHRAVFSTVIVGDRMSRVFRKLASEQKSHFTTSSSVRLCVHVCVTDVLHLLFPGYKCWSVNQLFGGARDRKGEERHRKLITLVCKRPSKKPLRPKPLHTEEMCFSRTRDWPVTGTIPASPCLAVSVSSDCGGRKAFTFQVSFTGSFILGACCFVLCPPPAPVQRSNIIPSYSDPKVCHFSLRIAAISISVSIQNSLKYSCVHKEPQSVKGSFIHFLWIQQRCVERPLSNAKAFAAEDIKATRTSQSLQGLTGLRACCV